MKQRMERNSLVRYMIGGLRQCGSFKKALRKCLQKDVDMEMCTAKCDSAESGEGAVI